jgi:RNA polymerase sigma-70 factor (ECF subfamily)
LPPDGGAAAAAPKTGLLCARLFCDFARPPGVLPMNDDPHVHNQPPGLAAAEDFTTFMRHYQDMVFSTAARIVRNDAQAEDISQEVFIKAHEHFAMLSTSASAGGWLKTVATNLSINHVQRYRRRWTFFSELAKPGEESSGTPEFAAPDTFFDGIDASERRLRVDEALARLPDHQRLPLVLFHYEDLSYEEIARRLGVSLAKVKTDILRARAALAKILSSGLASSAPVAH